MNQTYDAAGNPTTLRGTSSIPYNSNNQRTGTGYACDGAGNPTTYKSTTLAFDAENRMTSYGMAQTDGYRPDGQRATKTWSGVTRYYVYDGDDLLLDTDGSGNLINLYTSGANGFLSWRQITDGSGVSFLFDFDPNGNPSARQDNTMAVGLWEAFDGFGKLRSSPLHGASILS